MECVHIKRYQNLRHLHPIAGFLTDALKKNHIQNLTLPELTLGSFWRNDDQQRCHVSVPYKSKIKILLVKLTIQKVIKLDAVYSLTLILVYSFMFGLWTEKKSDLIGHPRCVLFDTHNTICGCVLLYPGQLLFYASSAENCNIIALFQLLLM